MPQYPDYQPSERLAVRARIVQELYGITGEKRAIYDKVVASISDRRVRVLQEKYRAELADFHPEGVFKYADLPYWFWHKTDMAITLGLHRSKPLSILDIGMGAGHIGAIAKSLGHSYIGTDISVPIYDDICKALDLDRRIIATKRQEALPPMGQRFDLVMIIWQKFDHISTSPDGTRRYWTIDDWTFFFHDLAVNHFQRGGKLFIQLNVEIQKGVGRFNGELIEWCEARGALINRRSGTILFNDVRPSLGIWPGASVLPEPIRLAT